MFICIQDTATDELKRIRKTLDVEIEKRDEETFKKLATDFWAAWHALKNFDCTITLYGRPYGESKSKPTEPSYLRRRCTEVRGD